MQEVGERANLVADLLVEHGALGEDALGSGIQRAGLSAQQLREAHGLNGELLAGDVMQVARDVAALLVLQFQQAPGKLTKRFLVDAQGLIGLDHFGEFGGHDARRGRMGIVDGIERQAHQAGRPSAGRRVISPVALLDRPSLMSACMVARSEGEM